VIYEYRCQDCREPASLSFEMGTAPVSIDGRCPECGDGDLVRRYTLGGFHLTGDGWGRDA
jgi:putative FmdB family regulatory protein